MYYVSNSKAMLKCKTNIWKMVYRSLKHLAPKFKHQTLDKQKLAKTTNEKIARGQKEYTGSVRGLLMVFTKYGSNGNR